MNDDLFNVPWLDENNEFFLPKVFIAIKVWKHIFGDPYMRLPNVNVKESLIQWLKDHEEWLNEHEVELDEQDIEDISIIITPDYMKKVEDRFKLPHKEINK
jgi:hypothetical protein